VANSASSSSGPKEGLGPGDRPTIGDIGRTEQGILPWGAHPPFARTGPKLL